MNLVLCEVAKSSIQSQFVFVVIQRLIMIYAASTVREILIAYVTMLTLKKLEMQEAKVVCQSSMLSSN